MNMILVSDIGPVLGFMLMMGFLAAIVVCFLKGKIGLGIFGLLTGFGALFCVVGAFLPAKPSSWWAKRSVPPCNICETRSEPGTHYCPACGADVMEQRRLAKLATNA
jgi:hypothetical protein